MHSDKLQPFVALVKNA